jgi:hypothetical protein
MQYAEMLCKRWKGQKLDNTTCDAVYREDCANLPWVKAEATRKVERKFRILGCVFRDRVAEEDGKILVVCDGVESKDGVSRKIDDGLIGEHIAISMAFHCGRALPDGLARQEGGSGLAVNERGTT